MDEYPGLVSDGDYLEHVGQSRRSRLAERDSKVAPASAPAGYFSVGEDTVCGECGALLARGETAVADADGVLRGAVCGCAPRAADVAAAEAWAAERLERALRLGDVEVRQHLGHLTAELDRLRAELTIARRAHGRAVTSPRPAESS